MIRLYRTAVPFICPVHGNSVQNKVELIDPTQGAVTRKVCQKCLSDAVEAWQHRVECGHCGGAAKRGNGVEKDGVFTPLCMECMTKHFVARS